MVIYKNDIINMMMNKPIRLYVLLCCLFSTIVVSGNMIFQKYINLPFFDYNFELSVGVLLYPVTFLISDLVTEFYGKEAAGRMVIASIICSLLTIGLLKLSDQCEATTWSVINDETFHRIFNSYGTATIASIIAIFLGQLIDVYTFSYLKELTNSRHLWLRNNASTIIAQFIDTLTVLSILCYFKIIPWLQFDNILASSFTFKVLASISMTPFCYLGYYLIRGYNNQTE